MNARLQRFRLQNWKATQVRILTVTINLRAEYDGVVDALNGVQRLVVPSTVVLYVAQPSSADFDQLTEALLHFLPSSAFARDGFLTVENPCHGKTAQFE